MYAIHMYENICTQSSKYINIYVIKSGLTTDQKHTNQPVLSPNITKYKIQFKQRKWLQFIKCLHIQIK